VEKDFLGITQKIHPAANVKKRSRFSTGNTSCRPSKETKQGWKRKIEDEGLAAKKEKREAKRQRLGGR